MPGQEDEASAIFEWLARAVSVDTYVNIMDQYRSAFQVGARDPNGKYHDIDRSPLSSEIEKAFASARDAGLWRFDRR